MKRVVYKFSHSMDAHTFILEEEVYEDDDLPAVEELESIAQDLALEKMDAWFEVVDE